MVFLTNCAKSYCKGWSCTRCQGKNGSRYVRPPRYPSRMCFCRLAIFDHFFSWNAGQRELPSGLMLASFDPFLLPFMFFFSPEPVVDDAIIQQDRSQYY